jgi:hypothetical protein
VADDTTERGPPYRSRVEDVAAAVAAVGESASAVEKWLRAKGKIS